MFARKRNGGGISPAGGGTRASRAFINIDVGDSEKLRARAIFRRNHARGLENPKERTSITGGVNEYVPMC